MRISDWSSDVCSSDLVSVSLIGMQAGISGEAFEDELLAATRSHISRLFAFDAMDIVLVDEGDSGFHFATGAATLGAKVLGDELDRRVADGQNRKSVV